MLKKTVSKVCLSLVATGLFVSCSQSYDARENKAPDARPNIILLMTDDMGWGDTGYAGHPHLKTPHLDEMAKSGAVLQRFYSAAPVCSPTRASVLTGRHPFREEVYWALLPNSLNSEQAGNILPRDQPTLASELKQVGYQTGFFGKWHLGAMTIEIEDGRFGGSDYPQLHSAPWHHGFDRVFATESRVPTYDPMQRPANRPGASETREPAEVKKGEEFNRLMWSPEETEGNARFFGTHYWNDGERVAPKNMRGDDSKIMMDQVVKFVEAKSKSEEPFLAVVWFHTPHTPLVASLKDQALYAEHNLRNRTYYGAVTAMDRQVGRLRAALRGADIADNTALWFTSDNGPEKWRSMGAGETGGLRGRKRSLFEGGIRVPGIIEWPAAIKPGSIINTPAVTSDILPTVLSWAKTSYSGNDMLDGIDLTPFIRGDLTLRPRAIGFESSRQLALIDNQYKLIHSVSVLPKGGSNPRLGQSQETEQIFELFDLISDPNETQNIADNHPDLIEGMTKELKAWRASVAASIKGDEVAARETLTRP